MTFKNAVKLFVKENEPFSDYWAMQLQWSTWTDLLCKQGTITSRQFHIWGNPCTPETFKRFNKKFKGGASRRGCWFGSTK